MNILRELRKTGKRSIAVRVKLVLMFSIVLITNTYAWWNINKKVNLGNLEAEVESWDVAYVVNDKEVLDETVSFTVNEVYPGMPDYEDYVHIYNMGSGDTKIEFEIEAIKIFGQDVLEELKQNNEIKEEGNDVTLFVNDTSYPFCIKYTFDKNTLEGEYENGEYKNGEFIDKKDNNGKYGYETNNKSVATLSFNINWEYDAGKDDLDTQMGKKAYEYYKNAEDNDGKAIEVNVKITSQKM